MTIYWCEDVTIWWCGNMKRWQYNYVTKWLCDNSNRWKCKTARYWKQIMEFGRYCNRNTHGSGGHNIQLRSRSRQMCHNLSLQTYEESEKFWWRIREQLRGQERLRPERLTTFGPRSNSLVSFALLNKGVLCLVIYSIMSTASLILT